MESKIRKSINMFWRLLRANGASAIVPTEEDKSKLTFLSSKGTWEEAYAPTGATGPQGPVGPEGPQGVQGVPGEKGEKGDPFSIAKIYSSVKEMNDSFATDDIKSGQFVLINTRSVQDEDDAKLFVKTDTEYSFITDLSGAAGIQGPIGNTGPQGEQGPRGEQGAIGATGAQGPKGDTGEAGKDAVVTSDTVCIFSNTEGSDVSTVVIPETDVPKFCKDKTVLNASCVFDVTYKLGDTEESKTYIVPFALSEYVMHCESSYMEDFDMIGTATFGAAVTVKDNKIATELNGGSYSNNNVTVLIKSIQMYLVCC